VKEFRTRAIINAPVAVVWETLTDPKSYPQFDDNCIKIDGNISEGKTIKLYLKAPIKRTLKAKVIRIKENELMRWETKLPFNILKNIRTFTLIAKDDQTTEFLMAEVFDGHFFSLFKKSIPDLSTAFASFSKGLKHFIESRP
jgi:hypothetical protein